MRLSVLFDVTNRTFLFTITRVSKKRQDLTDMTEHDIFLLVSAVLGGLALFIFGMNVMAEGLRAAAGSHLRTILGRATENRFAGISLGTVLGFLVHSSATTVMLVGFVNAGLTTLVQSVPPILGANIGTTISMQMISFKLDKYCFFAIAVGFIIQMLARGERQKQIGRAILGFGLLFLGMKTMSGAIKPHREALAPILANVDGSTLPGMLLGVLISTSITGIIQSSGATIGMCYALISAGVFTQLPQVYPIVLGAHIGTCATAMLGSIGTNIEARRTAVSHLLFNILNVIMAVSASRFFFWLIPKTSGDLVHQVANLHTAIMLTASLPILLVPRLYAGLVRLVVPSKKPRPQPSHLDDSLIDTPEQAIAAAIQELRRVSQIAAVSLRTNADLFFRSDPKGIQTVKLNEKIINEIKLSMREYLDRITMRFLTRRQTTLVRHIDRCMVEIERIGDHVDELCDLSVERNNLKDAIFDVESFETMFDLYKEALEVLHLVIQSLDPEVASFHEIANKILRACQEYKDRSMEAEESFKEKMKQQIMSPRTNVLYSQYLAVLDRIVRHAKVVARAESDRHFWIRPDKLERHADSAPQPKRPPLVDPDKFLGRLDPEDYA